MTFTGSAATGQQLRAHPNLVAKSIPFTMEADSLNCCVLGEDVTPEQPEFALFIREVVREMTAKAGQNVPLSAESLCHWLRLMRLAMH
ncbi:bifunctional aldehyde dehydrogenase/enoyl-CoA hydratase [Klebsiella pneumoniae]|uniref:Bifunctional aldehyde dehydrogenase/enoyl-CoA hydratase n=1 Tax=Klebsiella pneumoniae TaxID=573 RepID=A0A377TRK9_KLEPN|nr:bifunctional aldehyde dehydrogenase/enoyl-CoA hydratase [Klebsiella pneumoniae]